MSVVCDELDLLKGKCPWAAAPLSELCEFHNGLWKGKKGPFETVAVIRNTNFTSDGRVDLTDVAILEVEARQLAKRRLQKSDIVIEKSGGGPKQPVGRVALFDLESDDKYSFSNFTSAIRVARADRIDPLYLHRVLHWWYASGRTELLQSHSTGIRNLDFNAYKELLVPLPPLDEQKRIVAVLEKACTALDRACANAEANLEAAANVFNRTVERVLRGYVTDTCTIGEVCEIQSGTGFPNKEQGQKSGKYPFYKVSDMNLPGNEWQLKHANNYIDEVTRGRLRAAVMPRGAIVFPKVGGAIATNKKRVIEVAGCVDNNVMGLIPKMEKIDPSYVHEWLYATDIYDFSNKANPPSITQGTVRDWPIPVPTRPRQEQIVEEIRAMRKATTLLVKAYESTLKDLADLRQSLLRKAFSGQLA